MLHCLSLKYSSFIQIQSGNLKQIIQDYVTTHIQVVIITFVG